MKTLDPSLLAQISNDTEAIKKSVAKTLENAGINTIIVAPVPSDPQPRISPKIKLVALAILVPCLTQKKSLALPTEQDIELGPEQLINFIRAHSIRNVTIPNFNRCNTNDFATYIKLCAISKQINGTERIWRTRYGRAILNRRKQLRNMIRIAQR